ncbi:TIGR03617 family F420-dependent LLM class oxidoreductase [Myxococcota bacterium]|nr:TIGR03617 family F420-dependent LLM class oxidoreductase [Myxococcota bacterium]
MKFDTMLRTFDLSGIPAHVERFERLGIDGLWTFEAEHDPFLPLAVAASRGADLDLGTNISVAFGRSPFSMAQVAWDLQSSSNGKFHLGLGTQVRAHVERRFSMPFDQPAKRLADYIRCLRSIWDTFQKGNRPDYKGEFYQFTLMNPFFNPGAIDNPHIPIWIAGVNTGMCRIAGEVADGFHVHPMHSAGYVRDVIRPAISRGASSENRLQEDIGLYAPVFAVTGETQAELDESEAEVRRQISFYASTPNYRAVLDYHDAGGIAKDLSAKARSGEWRQMAELIPDRLIEEFAVVAKPTDLAAKLRERYDGLLDRVSLYFPLPRDDSDEVWTDFLTSFRTNSV